MSSPIIGIPASINFCSHTGSDAINIGIQLYNNRHDETINNSKLSFDSLRKKVASRGGTTEAAINCLKKNSFQKLIYSSVNHSIKKAKNLGSKKVK